MQAPETAKRDSTRADNDVGNVHDTDLGGKGLAEIK